MSVFEQIFFDPGELTVGQAGAVMASHLGLQFRWDHRDPALWTENDTDLPAQVRGFLTPNYDIEPESAAAEDIEVFNSLPMTWALCVAKNQYEHQQAVALMLFRRMADRLAWPCVLTHEYENLIATFEPERGVRTFPPGTRSDGVHEHLWR